MSFKNIFKRNDKGDVDLAEFRLTALEASVLEVLLESKDKALCRLEIGMALLRQDRLPELNLGLSLHTLESRGLVSRTARLMEEDNEEGPPILRAFHAVTPLALTLAEPFLPAS